MEEQAIELPPFHADAEGQDLGWHALNYRTAHTLQAHWMWVELEKYVREEIRSAVLQERERCARVCEELDEPFYSKRDELIERCAAAIRKPSPPDSHNGCG
jgi:hypothetical protein